MPISTGEVYLFRIGIVVLGFEWQVVEVRPQYLRLQCLTVTGFVCLHCQLAVFDPLMPILAVAPWIGRGGRSCAEATKFSTGEGRGNAELSKHSASIIWCHPPLRGE